jgi:hypothetical protein
MGQRASLHPTELLSLAQALGLCCRHVEAQQDALLDMKSRAFTQEEMEQLSPSDRRLLDPFAYRYTRLQDDMGKRRLDDR